MGREDFSLRLLSRTFAAVKVLTLGESADAEVQGEKRMRTSNSLQVRFLSVGGAQKRVWVHLLTAIRQIVIVHPLIFLSFESEQGTGVNLLMRMAFDLIKRPLWDTMSRRGPQIGER